MTDIASARLRSVSTRDVHYRPTALARIWNAPLLWHVVAYVLLLLVVALSIPLGSSVSSDEGAYAVQVHALQEGGWSFDHPFEDIDPDGLAYPFVNSRITDQGYFPLATTPVYIRILEASVGIFGRDVGLHLPTLIGAVMAAASAWLLGASVRPSLARLSFWLVAMSPVLVNAPMLWAHALAAGFAGLAMVGATRIVQRRARETEWILLTFGLLGAVAVRSDAVAITAATCLVLGGISLRAKRYATALGAGAVAVATASFVIGQRQWTAALTGSGPAEFDRQSRGVDPVERLRGVYTGLARGGWSDGDATMLGVLIGATVAYMAWTVWSRSGRPRHLIGGSVVVLALFALRQMVASDDLITGLFIAWPILLIGLVARRWRDLVYAEQFLLGTAGVGALGVMALQHISGAGLEWGGRYYSTLLVPLGVLVAGGLHSLVEQARATSPTIDESISVDRKAFPALEVALVSLAVVPTLFGMAITGNIRDRHDRIVTQIEMLEADVAISAEPALPRIAWRTVADTAWMRAAQLDPNWLAGQVASTASPKRMALIGVDDPDPITGYGRSEVAPYIWLYERIG